MLVYLRLFLNTIYEALITDEGIDPRTAKYPLLATPWYPVTIILVYLLFVLKIGPDWMKNRKQYDVKNIIIIYNAIQVLINFTVAFMLCYAIYMDENYDLICMPPNYERKDHYMMILVNFSYMFYISKYVDLFDTIFFVLKKKSKQKSFLHVYHHAVVTLTGYFGLRFYAGSQATIPIIINSTVHIVMYGYYLFTSLYSNNKTNIWWKKYLTLLQIIQFFISGTHFGILPFIVKDCNIPWPVCLFCVTQYAFLSMMFSEFYYKEYIRPKKEVKTQ